MRSWLLSNTLKESSPRHQDLIKSLTNTTMFAANLMESQLNCEDCFRPYEPPPIDMTGVNLHFPLREWTLIDTARSLVAVKTDGGTIQIQEEQSDRESIRDQLQARWIVWNEAEHPKSVPEYNTRCAILQLGGKKEQCDRRLESSWRPYCKKFTVAPSAPATDQPHEQSI